MQKLGFKLTLTILLAMSALSAQVLTNDTLIIGTVYGYANQQVVVPISIRSSVPYQGWQIPVKFGNGTAPLHCDSLSLAGSCMMSVPHEWEFIAPFVNNNGWDNTYTAGVAGLVEFMLGEDLPAGYWTVMKLYITIAGDAQPQTIVVDTASSRWNQTGPLNSFMVTVNSSSRMTVVRPGAIRITMIGAEESDDLTADNVKVGPNPLTRGMMLKISGQAKAGVPLVFSIIDAAGRTLDNFERQSGEISYDTSRLSGGVYFVVLEREKNIVCKKIVVQ